jgi:hypothetical protein
MCSESKEQWEEEADEARGMFVDSVLLDESFISKLSG